MSTQKQHSRSAYASFCPTAPLVVAGTAEWGVEDANSSPASLEILSLDLMRQGVELPRVGQPVPLPAPLLTLTWGCLGVATKQSKFGILAGSLSSGEVSLLDPTTVISGSGSSAVIHSWKPSPPSKVNSLSFSPKMPNMLTCGTSAGEVMLFDIANPRVPRQGFGDEAIATYRPSHRSAGTSEVLAVRFNHISDRILAVGFANGHAHIFDSRKQRAVMEMVDESAPRRVASLAWSPSNQTNIVLASDHDSSPTLQFWDLRMGKAPKLEYVGHSRGVTDVAWCPQQPSVIVSSGKDHQTILWDVPSGDRLGCFVPRDPGVMFQVAWSPTSPGTFLSCQAGRAVHVANYTGTACSIESVTDPISGQVVTQQVSRPLTSAPPWMRRRCCARFGWGGKLVTVKAPLGKDTSRPVVISSVLSEPELAVHSRRFEQAMVSNLQEYCLQKVAEEDKAEGEYWSFIKVLLEEENRETAMLSMLGFANEVVQQSAPAASEQVEAAAALLQGAQISSTSPRAGAGGEDDDFFGGMGPSPKDADAENDDFFGKLGDAQVTTTLRSHRSGVSDSGVLEQDGAGEADIQRFLFVGNHAAAIDSCISQERFADALVIAHISGQGDLWRSTLKQYMQHCPHPYLRIIDSQMNEDFDALIKQRSLAKWAETLAILLTYARDDFKRLSCKLAERLKRSSMVHPAVICYICASNVDAAISLWLQEASDKTMPVHQLQRVLEKSIALSIATKDPSAANNQALCDLKANYALQLVNQGCLGSAMKYLVFPESISADRSPRALSGALAVLKDRVYKSADPEEVGEMPAPHFPFEYVDLPQSTEGYAAQQAIYDLYMQQQQQQEQAAKQAAYATQQQAWQHSQQNAHQPQSAYQQASYQPVQAYQPTHTPSYGASGSYHGPPSPPAAPPPAAPSLGYERSVYRVDGNYSTAQRTYSFGQPPTNGASLPPSAAQLSQQAPPHPPPAAAPVPMAPVKPYTGSRQATPLPVQPQAPGAPPLHPGPPQYATPTPQAQTQAAPPPPRVFQPTYSAPPPPAPPVQSAPPAMPPAQSQQLPQAAHQAPPEPPAPAGPPPDCSIYNADTSCVSGPGVRVVQSLTALYQAVEPLGQQSMAKQKEIQNSAQRLGILFWQLNNQQLSSGVLALLEELANAVARGDWMAAQQFHIKLTGSHWDECGQWLQAIKRLIKARQSLG